MAAATEQTFGLGCAPETDDAHAPSGRSRNDGNDPSRARPGPRPDRLVRWKPTRDHLGDSAAAGHATDGRTRRGGRLSGRDRTADAVRGRDAASAPGADVPAPFAALDDHGPRRGAARRLTCLF